MSEKSCKTCLIVKPLSEFRYRKQHNGKYYYEPYCIPCEKEKNKIRLKKRYQENKEQISVENKKNSDERNKKNKKWREENKKYLKEYRLGRREDDLKNLRNWFNKKRKEDVSFKLREIISSSINRSLRKLKSGKNGESCLKYINYTFEELKIYLESQFESWMNWTNWGKYSAKTWDDNDPSTWTWQVDHIIPHSSLPYTSMEDENFKKCWALSNLRPLSAKQNLIDGVTKVRHKNSLNYNEG